MLFLTIAQHLDWRLVAMIFPFCGDATGEAEEVPLPPLLPPP